MDEGELVDDKKTLENKKAPVEGEEKDFQSEERRRRLKARTKTLEERRGVEQRRSSQKSFEEEPRRRRREVESMYSRVRKDSGDLVLISFRGGRPKQRFTRDAEPLR